MAVQKSKKSTYMIV